MSVAARLVWAYLPCHADREGRLADKPFALKLDIMPLDDVDMNAVLGELAERRHIIRFSADGRKCIQIRNFSRYQHPHIREANSILPVVPMHTEPSASPVLARKLPGQPGGDDPVMRGSGKILASAKPESEFSAWYSAYPKKKKPRDAQKAWVSTAKERPPLAAMLKALEWQRRSPEWTKDGGAYVPYPGTYLRGGSWADEPMRAPIPLYDGSRSPQYPDLDLLPRRAVPK